LIIGKQQTGSSVQLNKKPGCQGGLSRHASAEVCQVVQA
jgi:hypothetical protein